MRIGLWLVIALVALCAGVAGAFVGNQWSDANGPMSPKSLHAIVHDNLGLTAAQEAELDVIEAQFAEDKRALEERLKTAKRTLAEAIDEDKDYSPRVAAAIEEFHHAMGELQKLTIEHVFEMRALLTEEQAETFDAEVVRALTED